MAKTPILCKIFGHRYGHSNTAEFEGAIISHSECERRGCDYIRKHVTLTVDVDCDDEGNLDMPDLEALKAQADRKIRELARTHPNVNFRINGKKVR